jgi:hypothetical protein
VSRREIRQARAAAIEADQRLQVAYAALAGIGDPRLRAALLVEISGDLQRREDGYAAATGRLVPATESAEALVALWLAATEVLSADGAREGMAPAVAAAGFPVPWPAARPLLDRLCQTTDLAERAVLVDALHGELVHMHGYAAAGVFGAVEDAYRALAAAAVRAEVAS